MKSTLSLLVACLCISLNLFAQAPAEFGKITKDELQKTASLLDKSAEAEVLFETSEVSLAIYGGHLEISMKNHVRVKIYNEKGLEEANIKLRYIQRGRVESIQKLDAQTYTLDESGNVKISKLDKKNVFEKRINNRIAEQSFSFPEVKVGSVIEYKYTLVRRESLFLSGWDFQRNIPVLYSSITIQYPKEFVFTPSPNVSLPLETKNGKSSMYEITEYIMTNVPALKDEPFISSREDYLQRIKFNLQGYYSGDVNLNLTTSWPKVIQELLDDPDFGPQLKKNIPRTNDLNNTLAKLATPLQKMVAIHDYVKKNMVWDEKTSIWALDGVKASWENKKGNSGEINLILVNLLKDAGLNAHPVLVSTRDNGRIQTLDPGIDQFNTVMAYVMIDSSLYVLDGTDKVTPSNLIPSSVVFTEGLVINKVDEKAISEESWGWRNLWDEKKTFFKLVNIAGELLGSGKIKGSAYVMNKDYAKAYCLEQQLLDSAAMTEKYASIYNNFSLWSLDTKNDIADTLPLEQTFEFEMPVIENGGYSTFSLNLFSGLHKNPFLAEKRSSDIFFGYNQRYMIRGSYKLPEGYEFEELPKNIRMINPDKTIEMTRRLQQNQNIVSFSLVLEFKQPYYSIEEYADFAEFYKQLSATLNEPLVVKKTTNP